MIELLAYVILAYGLGIIITFTILTISFHTGFWEDDRSNFEKLALPNDVIVLRVSFLWIFILITIIVYLIESAWSKIARNFKKEK